MNTRPYKSDKNTTLADIKTMLQHGLLIFCLLIFIPFCCPGSPGYPSHQNPQERRQRLVKIHYENSSGEKGITFFEYDANGIVQTATWKLLDGSRYSKNYHTYDRSGNLVRRYREFSDGLISSNTYEYDENNYLVKETFERSDSLRTVTTYEYADDGTRAGSFRKYSNDLTADFRYEFDGNRRLAYRSFARSDGVTGSEEYFYTEKGQLEKGVYNHVDTWLNGTITFDHDKSGNLTKGQFKGDNGFDALINFDHDEYGNVTLIHWEFSFKKTQTYGFTYEKMNL